MNRYQHTSMYCYPGTDVLKNLYDIKDLSKLELTEKRLVSKQLFKLQENPIAGGFDLGHLQKIHKFIFKEIYPFAGKLRNEGISKGTTHFAAPEHLKSYANNQFKMLKQEKKLSGLEFDSFVERMSYYMAEINMIHPFREGNGRTQREFFRELALYNGFVIEWENVNKEELMTAAKRSVVNEKAYIDLFNKIIVNQEPNETLMNQYRQKIRRSMDQLEL
ncbi:hypothetical protein UP12_19660 (plasmid) [Bacillus pumilus]|uniref:Fic/DOC family protein n=1 Tax=Bacillus pumilus TaxID=1408 RepID=UPI0007768702|nr:Fic family protein [Bacillus pumilus]AMM99622.1 hypothetical protein UP12_19660 [Bacillus pumilus]